MPGEKPQFEDLYRQYLNRVYGFVRAQVRDPVEAEDVTAQVFIKAWDAYPRYRPEAATPAAWLFQIARNACVDHARSRARRSRLAEAVASEERSAAETDPAQVATDRVQAAGLLDLVATLPERTREVIALRHTGLGFEDVGAVVGLSEDAAKMSYHRALRVLRDRARLEGLI